MDRTPPPRGPSRVWAIAVAFAVLVLLASCGEEAPPPQQWFPLPAVSSEDALRDWFSLHAGAECARAYAELGPLQATLRRLRRAVWRRAPARRPAARSRAEEVVERIELTSVRFLRRFEAIPLPSAPRRRQDAARLVETTGELVRLQLENLDLAGGILGEPGRASRTERARLQKLQRGIGAQLREQQTLARRLDIPECVVS